MADYVGHIRAIGERSVRWLTEASGRTREQALGNLEVHLKGQGEYSPRLMSDESRKKAAEILLISSEHRLKQEKA